MCNPQDDTTTEREQLNRLHDEIRELRDRIEHAQIEERRRDERRSAPRAGQRDRRHAHDRLAGAA